MRTCSIFVLAIAALLASVNSDEVKASPNVAPTSRRSLSTRDRDTPQRSLRVHYTEDDDESEEEERAGGTDIVMWAHKLKHADAKMVRQIAKGNSPEHILDKLKVPYELINGERVYSLANKHYARYVKWLKKYRDHPLTFPN
ncbi:hypothetical protein PF010_g32249 [Phytophthora fragariae]|uniref:RxLR effector protein n=1 Tax=Phytophthora fragariae TaxID=53985 RepID=A0A6A3JM07_9STRA|nr:hypothetical protein PF011_g17242 [Phytophthora fragariae]KAE9055179.1 hypothetical protein PF010_g32249 [Phytophthora fragariae]